MYGLQMVNRDTNLTFSSSKCIKFTHTLKQIGKIQFAINKSIIKPNTQTIYLKRHAYKPNTAHAFSLKQLDLCFIFNAVDIFHILGKSIPYDSTIDKI